MIKNMYVSLKTKLVLLIFFSVVLISSFAISQQLKNIKELQNNIGATFKNESNNLGNAISAQFYERYGDVQAFALNKEFTEKNSENDMITTLYKYSLLFGIYDVILFVDPHGKYIASNSLSPQNKPIDISKLKLRDY